MRRRLRRQLEQAAVGVVADGVLGQRSGVRFSAAASAELNRWMVVPSSITSGAVASTGIARLYTEERRPPATVANAASVTAVCTGSVL